MTIENLLKKEYIQTMLRFKKSSMYFHHQSPLTMTELCIMTRLSTQMAADHQCAIDLAELQNHTHISKAAISQLFTSLEKKGYLIRETDKTNRRRITVALTSLGEQTLTATRQQTERRLDDIIRRLGEDNMRQLIALLNRLSDISDEIRDEESSIEDGESNV